MAAKPICSTMDHTYEGWKVSNIYQQQNNIACTMMHRLCHLIFRLETSMCWQTYCASAWYLREMVPYTSRMPDDMKGYLEELRTRLQRLIDGVSQRHNDPPDPDEFDRFRLACGVGSEWVLVDGPPLYHILQPPSTEPSGRISRYVNDFMWTQQSVSSL